MRCLTYLVGGAAVTASLLVSAPAVASTPDNWGQEVKECNLSGCYGDGASRGDYVSVQATDGESPGYAWEIHTLANPGSADPTLP